MVQVQFKYRQERDIYDDHATSTFAVQAGERDLYLMVMQRVHLKYRLERDLYLMVMQRVQVRYILEREKDIRWSCNGCN